MKLYQFLILLGVIILGFVALGWFASSTSVGGELFLQKPSFYQGFYAGTSRQLEVSNAGVITASGALNLDGAVDFDSTVDFGGEITLSGGNCTTTTWNPASVTSTAPALLEMTMPSGYSIGDVVLVSFSTNTQGLWLSANPTGTAGTAVTVKLQVPADANYWPATDLATGTVKACYFD